MPFLPVGRAGASNGGCPFRAAEIIGGTVKKSVKAGAILLAGIFVLSGCGSSAEGVESGAAESSAAGAESASSTPASTPTTTPAVGRKQYTADQLEAVLTAVKDSQGITGPIANDATLRPELEAATDSFNGITITPEECSDLVTSGLGDKIDSAHFAILQLGVADTVTIISYADESFIENQIENNNQQMIDCAEFQMELGGQVISSTGEEIAASTAAPVTQAYNVRSTSADEETANIQLTAFSGTTSITLAMQNPGDSAGAVAAAEEMVNAVLAELEKN